MRWLYWKPFQSECGPTFMLQYITEVWLCAATAVWWISFNLRSRLFRPLKVVSYLKLRDFGYPYHHSEAWYSPTSPFPSWICQPLSTWVVPRYPSASMGQRDCLATARFFALCMCTNIFKFLFSPTYWCLYGTIVSWLSTAATITLVTKLVGQLLGCL